MRFITCRLTTGQPHWCRRGGGSRPADAARETKERGGDLSEGGGPKCTANEKSYVLPCKAYSPPPEQQE